MSDQSKKNEKVNPDALTDAELDKVAGGGLRDALRGDTGGFEPRGPARTTEGDPRKGFADKLRG